MCGLDTAREVFGGPALYTLIRSSRRIQRKNNTCMVPSRLLEQRNLNLKLNLNGGSSDL